MHKLMLGFSVLLAAPVGAVNFVVDYWAEDQADLVPGDGVCAWSTSAPLGQRCTLRAAIMEANALPGEHTIAIPGGAHIVLSIPGRNEDAAATGDLDITKSLTIGSNSGGSSRPIIDANGIDRVFDIHPTAVNVVLNGLQITGGLANSASTTTGGGILSDASGVLVVIDSEIRGNSANAGGGMRVLGNTRIVGSSVRENIAANYGFTNVEGAGIFANTTGIVVEIEASSITTNIAMTGGPGSRAGLEVHGIAQLRIENSTVSGNLPNGIHLQNADSLDFNHLTLVGSSGTGTGLRVFKFSGSVSGDINNSVIAGFGTNCQFTGAGIYSYSHNYTLSDDDTCRLSGFGVGNLIGVDPQLHPLSVDDWTDTRVHLPRGGSPVIDTADPLLAPSGSCLLEDQVGRWRPLPGDQVPGARCDMGAVEYVDRLFAHDFEPIIG